MADHRRLGVASRARSHASTSVRRLERLAEAAKRVAPGAVYYGVMQGDRQVGFASSTIDTTDTSITVTRLFRRRPSRRRKSAAHDGAHERHAVARAAHDELSTSRSTARARRFAPAAASTATACSCSRSARAPTKPIRSGSRCPARFSFRRSCRSPSRLTEPPKIGKHYVLPVFDPARMAPTDVGFDVRAESLFVVNDSAVYDSTTRALARRAAAIPFAPGRSRRTRARGFSGWIDEQGRIVADVAARLRAPPAAVRSRIRELAERHDARADHGRSRHSRDDGDRGEQAHGRRRRARSIAARSTRRAWTSRAST